MLTKNSEKLIRSLAQRKNRKKTGLFVAEGMKLVRDFVSAGISADIVYHVDELGEDFRDVRCVQISEAEMKRITFLETPSPILALFEQPNFGVEDFQQANFILLLDRVQDPGNMGTLLRTALWYGVDCVATTVGTVDPFSPKVVQSSMSAHAFSRIVQLEEEQWAHGLVRTALAGSSRICTVKILEISIGPRKPYWCWAMKDKGLRILEGARSGHYLGW